MDKRVKGLWTDALRSGEYEQGVGALRRTDGNGNVSYCCLGVLCEIAIKDGVEVHYDEERNTYDMQGAFLPWKVRSWAGMEEMDDSGTLTVPIAYLDEDDETNTATNAIGLNDGAHYSFTQIADVIEAQL